MEKELEKKSLEELMEEASKLNEETQERLSFWLQGFVMAAKAREQQQ